MTAKLKSSTCGAVAVALIAYAGVAWAASPVAGFGPAVSGDVSLQANMGALERNVAWQNSPDGDIFQLALSTPAPEMRFENVAIETASANSPLSGPEIYDDYSLDANMYSLHRTVAWQQSPDGDAFAFALQQLEPAPADFERVALASVPAGGFQPGE